ncbi:MAG: hypothetical protein DWQ04_20775 [Chloroflexi bacterium]|nr:MAG: hypothetical protein DWQ04_20775 [Chloroflexota bacterium]
MHETYKKPDLETQQQEHDTQLCDPSLKIVANFTQNKEGIRRMAHFILKATEEREGSTIINHLFRSDEKIASGSYRYCNGILHKLMVDGDTYQEISPSGYSSNILTYQNIAEERIADQQFRQGVPDQSGRKDRSDKMVPVAFSQVEVGQKIYKAPTATVSVVKIKPRPASHNRSCHRCGTPANVWINGQGEDGISMHICPKNIVFLHD